MLPHVDIHSALQFSSLLGQNFVLSFSVCPSSSSTSTTLELPLTFALLGNIVSSKTAQHLSDGCPSNYLYNLRGQLLGSQVSQLCVLCITYNLPHCFACLLSGFKEQLCTWHTHTHTHSPVCLLTMYFM